MNKNSLFQCSTHKTGIGKNCSVFPIAKLMFPDITLSVAVVLVSREAETQGRVQ